MWSRFNSQPSSSATLEKVESGSLEALYKAKAPQRATPAMAIRNGRCSMEAAALEGLEVEEADDDDWELVTLAEDEAGKLSQRTKVMKRVGRKIHTAAFLFLKFKGSLLVRSGAICSEAFGSCLLEARTIADTGEVGAADVSSVSENERSQNKLDNRDAQRSTSAVSEGCLNTRESTGIGGLGRDTNSSYQRENEEVKRTGEHYGWRKIDGWSDYRYPAVTVLSRNTPINDYII